MSFSPDVLARWLRTAPKTERGQIKSVVREIDEMLSNVYSAPIFNGRVVATIDNTDSVSEDLPLFSRGLNGLYQASAYVAFFEGNYPASVRGLRTAQMRESFTGKWSDESHEVIRAGELDGIRAELESVGTADIRANHFSASARDNLETQCGTHGDVWMARQMKMHKGGQTQSDFVSLTSDPKYATTFFQCIPNRFSYPVYNAYFVVRALPGDFLYPAAEYMRQFGLSAFASEETVDAEAVNDWEAEWLLGGGFTQGHIVWAQLIEFPGTTPVSTSGSASSGGLSVLESIRLAGELRTKKAARSALQEQARTVSVIEQMLLRRNIAELTTEINAITARLEPSPEQVRRQQLTREITELERQRAGLEADRDAGRGGITVAGALISISHRLQAKRTELRSIAAPDTAPSTHDAALERIVHGGAGTLDVGTQYTSDDDEWMVSSALSGGSHGAYLIDRQSDHHEFVWKPAASASGSASDMMGNAEIGGSKLAAWICGEIVPRVNWLTLNSVKGTYQKFSASCGRTFAVEDLNPAQAAQLVAHCIGDWVISNHDNNINQFLVDTEHSVIGFDKGQAFKHFKEGAVQSSQSVLEPDSFDASWHPSGNFNKPVGYWLTQCLEKTARGESAYTVQWDSAFISGALAQCEALTAVQVREFLEPYATAAFSGQEAAFYDAVASRANGMRAHVSSWLSRFGYTG